jgi:hypothetical protein
MFATNHKLFSELRLGEFVRFDYNGKPRAGRVENKMAGTTTGGTLCVEVSEGVFRSFVVDKIENMARV